MDKLRKTLLLMLLSPEPGEVMAAREAVLRMAKNQKLDPHQLALVMTKELVLREKGITVDEMLRSMSQAEARDIARYCWERSDEGRALSEREAAFVKDMMNCTYWPSAKQAKWLRSLGARMGYG
jgi:hypothetical protein